jgi:hypothetical protein
MGGGKSTTSVTVPEWLENAAKSGLSRAEDVSRIGYAPYYGPDVAAMTPMQMTAMQGTNQMASAFGMPTSDPMAGMPTAGDYGGMPAYSSGSMYDAALAELQRRQPDTYAKLMAPFAARPTPSFTSAPAPAAPAPKPAATRAMPLDHNRGR